MKLKQLGYLRVFYFTCYVLHFVLTEDITDISENTAMAENSIEPSIGNASQIFSSKETTNLATSMTATITCGSEACVQSITFPKPRHDISQFLGPPDDGFILFQPLIEFNATEESCLTQMLMSIKVYFSARITGFNVETESSYKTIIGVNLLEKESKKIEKGPLKLRVNKLYTACTNFGNMLKIPERKIPKLQCTGAKIDKFLYPGRNSDDIIVNPVTDFLVQKESSKEYPIMSLTKNSLLIDWGDLSRFGCDKLTEKKDFVSGRLSFIMNRPGEDTVIMESTSELNLDHEKPTRLKFDDIQVVNLNEIYCNPVLVTLTISNLKFGSTDDQEREPIVFRGREIKPRKFTATFSAYIQDKPLSEDWDENETDNRDTDRHLFLRLEAKTGSEPMCFENTAMVREVTDGSNSSEWQEESIYSYNSKKEIDVTAYREKQCQTRQIQVVIKSSFDNATVLDEIYTIPDSKIEGNVKTEITEWNKKIYLKLESDSKDNIFKCLQNIVTIEYGDNQTDTQDMDGVSAKYIDIDKFASEKCAKSEKGMQVTLKSLNNSVVFQKNITFKNSARGLVSAAVNLGTNKIELSGKMECIKEEVEIISGNSKSMMVKHSGKIVEFDSLENYTNKKCEKSPLSIHIKVEFNNGDLADDEYIPFPEAQITDTIKFERIGGTLCLLPNTTTYPFRFEKCIKKEAKVSLITKGLPDKSDMVSIELEREGSGSPGACEDKHKVDVSQYLGDRCRPEVLKVEIFDIDTEAPGYPSYNETLTSENDILSRRDEIGVEFDNEKSSLVINGDTSCLKDTVEITERNTSTFIASRNNTNIDFDLSEYKTRKCEKSPLTIGIKIDYVNGDIAFNNFLTYPEAEVTDKISFKLEDKKIIISSATDKPMRVDCFENNATATLTVDGEISKSGDIPIEETGILDVTDYVDDFCKSTIFTITLVDVDGSQYEHSENLKYNETLKGTLKLNESTEDQSYIIEMSTISGSEVKCLAATVAVTSSSLSNDQKEISIIFQDSKIPVIPLDQFMEKRCKATNITVEVKDVEQIVKLEQNYTLLKTKIEGSVTATDPSENKIIILESSAFDDVLSCIQSVVINDQSSDYKGSNINVSNYFMDKCICGEVRLDIIDYSNESRIFGKNIFTQPQTEFLPNIITAGRKVKREGKLLLKLDSNVKPIPCLKNKAIVTDANSQVTQQTIHQENGTTFIDITELESCHAVTIDIEIWSRANKSITLKNVEIEDSDDEGGCTGEMFEEDGNQLFNITCDHPSILNCLPEHAQVTKISENKTEPIKIIRKNNLAWINLTKFQMDCTDVKMLLTIKDEDNNLTLFETAVVNRLYKKEKVTGSLEARKIQREAYFSINTNDYSLNCLKYASNITVSASGESESIDIDMVNESEKINLTDYIANCTDTTVVVEIQDKNNEESLNERIQIPRFFPNGASYGIFKDNIVKIRAKETILHCLKDISEVTNIITSDKKEIPVNDYKINVSFFDKECQESILRILVQDKNDNVSLSKIIEQSLPLPELTIDNGAFRVNHNNSKFKKCEEMIQELECEDDNGITASKTFKFGELLMTSEYQGNKCKVRVFTKSYQKHLEHLSQSRSSPDLFEKNSNYTPAWSKVIEIPTSASLVEPVIGSMSVLFVLVIVVLGGGFWYRKKKNEDAEYNLEKIPLSSNYSNYRIFKKDKTLLKNLHTAARKKKEAVEEFKAIETWAEEEVEKVNTKEIGKENKIRNRYQDMVPYDNNRMKLKTKNSVGGNPPSDYINASPIKFTDFSQKFIAIQAPKPNMINSFWQLVVEQKVSVIVMITGLIEKGRVKAHQYWPDRENPVMDVGSGITVKYLSHSFPGTYYHRAMLVTDSHGKEMTVDQVHCVAWADMEAPKETKVLLDLLYKVQDLSDEKPGPIMVHCSAGVGRTGTFIGFYKLAHDYLNDNVNEINVFNAVSEMRKCRRFMVQKAPQYHYIYKCLADYVKAQEAVYD